MTTAASSSWKKVKRISWQNTKTLSLLLLLDKGSDDRSSVSERKCPSKGHLFHRGCGGERLKIKVSSSGIK